MEKFGKFMALMAMLVVGYLVVGMVTMYLWEWFVSPTFNVTTLSLVQAVGIVITSRFMFHKFKVEEDKEYSFRESATGFVNYYFACMVVLTLGYLVQLFL